MSGIERQEHGGKSCFLTLGRGKALSLYITIGTLLKIKTEEDSERANHPSGFTLNFPMGVGQ